MFRGWLKTVENRPVVMENSRVFSTASTASPLKFSRGKFFMPTLDPSFSQAEDFFTQPLGTFSPLLGWLIYTLSTAPIAANNSLNKY